MFRALSKSSTVAGAMAQRQAMAIQTRVQAVAAFHSSSIARNDKNNKNNNNNNNNNNSSSSSSAHLADIFASLRSNTTNTNTNTNTSTRPSSLFGGARSSTGGAGSFGSSLSSSFGGGRSEMPLFGMSAAKANTTANPIHLDTTHPTEGRSFKVNSPSMVDQTYRRLRSALNQSNMKRELRLRRTYETGHMRMRRENQERNKKLFGAMVRKKIELIKLMKIRGM